MRNTHRMLRATRGSGALRALGTGARAAQSSPPTGVPPETHGFGGSRATSRLLSGGKGQVRALICVLSVLLALIAGSAPADATIIDRARSTEPYEYVNWACGYPISVDGVANHQVQVRADKKSPDIVYFTDNYDFTEVWTTTDGRWLTVSANALAKDVPAKRVQGSVYQFAFKTTGQPFTVTDSSGALVVRERGNQTFSYTLDLADGTFTFLGIKDAGRHYAFTDADACKIVAPLLGGQSARYLTARPLGTTGSAMGYYAYLPPSYSSSGTRSPVLIALNGYGENGDGTPDAIGNLLLAGIPKFIDVGGWPTDRPLVVLAPQHVEEAPGFEPGPCDTPGTLWFGSCVMQLQHDRNHTSPAFCTTPYEVHDFVTYAVARYNVDPARVYVTGLSCGAFGLWEYLAKYGDQQGVAAAIPIAGEGRPAWSTAGCALGSVALWAFHGKNDDVVDPRGSVEPMAHLAGCSGVTADRARLTVYPDLTHDGWDQAYSGSLGDDIYKWMLSISRAPSPG